MGVLDGQDGVAAEQSIAVLSGAGGTTLGAAVKRHLGTLGRLAASTQANRAVALRGLVQALGAATPLQSITRAHVAEQLEQQLRAGRLKLSTVRLRHTQVVAFFGWAVRAGLIEADPSAGTSRLIQGKDDHAPRRGFQDHELRGLLPTLGDDLRRLTLAGLYSGLRIGELIQLKGADVTDALINVRRSKTRAAERVVPLHSRLAGLLDVSARKPVFDRWQSSAHASRAFGRALRREGLPRELSFHSCRHSFGQRLRDAAVPVETIAALMGHAVRGVTLQTYARTAPLDQLKTAVEQVQYDLG
jgi:integrase